MQLLIPATLKAKFVAELERAKTKEIGGVLMGEHTGENCFRLREVTVQRRGGGYAHFLRLVPDFISSLRGFFAAHKNDYKRFNYLGEWHSHPSFAPVPSFQDSRSMREIIDDPETGAHFAALLIIKMENNRIAGTVTIFQPKTAEYRGEIIWENENN